MQAQDYQLYLVYNLDDVQQTLDFVQQTLVLGGMALVLLIGAVAYLVVRLVVGPVRVAAETSEKLAAGQLEERLPEKGDDELATLARSFNRMADSLQRQIRQLADLSRVQQRFVSDVSHELRTPLTTIRLAGEVLYDQRKTFPPATARTAELLHAQTERFELLLADLLEMSRYDAGAVQLEVEPTNLVRLVEDADRGGHAARQGEGQPRSGSSRPAGTSRPRSTPAASAASCRTCSATRSTTARAGRSSSTSTATRMPWRSPCATSASGSPPADMARVFDRFWRADPSRQRSTGGTGLGLAISQEDAIVHGGELDVWSEPGRGSCFRLTIPRHRGELLGGGRRSTCRRTTSSTSCRTQGRGRHELRSARRS